MERVLNPEQLDQWFEQNAEGQYTRELLFSSIFDIMSLVVCGIRKTVHAAYQAGKENLGVSVTSVYSWKSLLRPNWFDTRPGNCSPSSRSWVAPKNRSYPGFA